MWVIDACISSKLFPLVSGTSFATKATVKPHMPDIIKNVPVVWLQHLFYYYQIVAKGRARNSSQKKKKTKCEKICYTRWAPFHHKFEGVCDYPRE